MADLLARVRGPCQDYAQRLLAHMAAASRPAAGAGALTAWTGVTGGPLLEPLSARELEVLQWLAEGASNRAIAEALVISVGTVKTHISRIMGKLGARNRTEAVARARQSGLLV
jgi:LuxR family maltose regulon positive regulatory protein